MVGATRGSWLHEGQFISLENQSVRVPGDKGCSTRFGGFVENERVSKCSLGKQRDVQQSSGISGWRV
jgi:hypothetical protein